MQDIVTLRGFVATDPAVRHTASGAAVTGFRLASTERRYDRDSGAWADAHTNWYSVSAFGLLGANTAQSVKKGNPVIVTGRLRIRDWATDERSGTSVDVVADSVGLDLGFGAVAFARTHRIASAPERAEAGGGFPAELPEALRGGDGGVTDGVGTEAARPCPGDEAPASDAAAVPASAAEAVPA